MLEHPQYLDAGPFADIVKQVSRATAGALDRRLVVELLNRPDFLRETGCGAEGRRIMGYLYRRKLKSTMGGRIA